MVTGETVRASNSTRMQDPLSAIALCATGALALIVVGGIYLASYVPRSVPLAPPVILLAAAGIALASAVVMLSRLRDFAWNRFFQVFKWTLLAYTVIAGMIGYAFVTDGTRGSVLVILVLMLAVFAADIPLLLAFSVARYADPVA